MSAGSRVNPDKGDQQIWRDGIGKPGFKMDAAQPIVCPYCVPINKALFLRHLQATLAPDQEI
ncbi:hypothetical protein hamaS1_21290 [Moorella sp. Hama-1]|nr:hypothetical protein hamaS1_21290 [Moorella sp. Hama-1]